MGSKIVAGGGGESEAAEADCPSPFSPISELGDELGGAKSAEGNEPGAGQGASSAMKVWPRYVWLREDEGEEPFESPHRAGRELCQGRPQGPAFLCPDCEVWLAGYAQWEDHKRTEEHMQNTRPMIAAADAQERVVKSYRLLRMLEAPEEGSEEEGEESRLRAELEEESRLRAELKVERRRARAVGLAWTESHEFF